MSLKMLASLQNQNKAAITFAKPELGIID